MTMADTYDTAPLPDRMTLFVPHAAALGMTLVSLERGRGVMRVDWREDLVGDPDTGVIASGVVTALIDHTCGLAINSAADTPCQLPRWICASTICAPPARAWGSLPRRTATS